MSEPKRRGRPPKVSHSQDTAAGAAPHSQEQQSSLCSAWPDWAPPSLVEIYFRFIEDCEGDSTTAVAGFQATMLSTIETLCTEPRLEKVWGVLSKHTSDRWMPRDLAEAITKALMPPSKAGQLTAAQRLRKREQAAIAARELRNHLTDLGLDSQTVFPVVGAKAMGLVLHYFLQGRMDLSVDLKWWNHEFCILNAMLMENEPGVGSWRDMLDRLAVAVVKGEETYQHTSKVVGQDDEDGRATNFAEQLSDLLVKYCAQLPTAQILQLTEVFFPAARLDYESLGRRLRRRHSQGG